MTFEKFKSIMDECHIDDRAFITDEYLMESYNDFNMDQYPDDKPYLCLTTPPIDGKTMVMVFWVHPLVRRKGIGSKLLQQIPTPHEMVVDYRSEGMHKMLLANGYTARTSYMIDDQTINLHGGDKLYSKE